MSQKLQDSKRQSHNHTPPHEAHIYTERLEAILARAVAELRLGGASVYVLNDAGNALKARASVDAHGRGRRVSPDTVDFKLSSRIGRVISGKAPSLTRTENAGAGVFNPDAAVPIQVGGAIVGLLSAQSIGGDGKASASLEGLGSFADEAGFIIDSAQTEAQMALEAHHEHTLSEVSKAISSAMDPNRILELVARLMAEGVGASKSAVYVWERDLAQLRRRASHGTLKRTARRYSAIAFPEDNALAMKLASNEPVILNEGQKAELAHSLRASVEAEHAIAAPLMSKGHLVAVAVVSCPESCSTFEADNIDLLMSIAAQAAVSIENATLYEAQNRAVTELAALYAVSQALAASLNLDDGLQIVAESIAAVTGVSRCGVFLIEQGRAHGHLVIGVPDEEKERFKRLSLGLSERETAMMHAIKEGRPTIVEGRATLKDGYMAARWRVTRMLVVPLIFEGRTVGLAAADEPGHAATFSTNTVKVAAAIGEQAAIAIQNARLYEQTRQHAEELQLLWEVGQALGGELGLEEMLDTLANHLKRLPKVAAVSIIVRHWDGSLLVAREDGGKTRYRSERALVDPCDVRSLPVMQGQQTQVIRDVRRHAKCLHEDLRMSQSQSHSILSVPLVQENKTIGLLNVISAEDRDFGTGEIRLIGSVSSVASAAVARGQVYERERRIAETFQRSLLPEVRDHYGSFEIGRQYAAALDEARVGGDFYDVFELRSGKIAFVIGDVSGKGLDAAVHTATAKYLVRAFAFEEDDPSKVLSRANDALCFYVPVSMFVTMFLAVLDTEAGIVYYSNAGHELPLLWSSAASRFRSLACTGRALGFLANCDYLTEEATLHPGDVLIMYTDGVTEARRDGKFFDAAGVREAAEPLIGSSASQLAEGIENEVRRFAGGRLRDDIALLVVKRQG